MIRRIQARNFCCLRFADVSLDRFHILVGPNASGKSTLLDVISFLGDMVSEGLEAAVEKRTRNFQDLVWRRPKKDLGFELAVEFDIPDGEKARLPQEKDFERFRYEVSIKEHDGVVRINSERGLLMPAEDAGPRQEVLKFPAPAAGPETILLGGGRPGVRTILSKSSEARDNFNVEVAEKAGKGWAISISFGPTRSTLGNLPESPDRFPVSTRIKRLLESGLQRLFLDSARMRQPTPPIRRREVFAADGSNLPRIILQLREENHTAFTDWLAHVRAALPDIDDVRVVEREDDRHCYLMLRYSTGVEVPSWKVSDGTLRLLRERIQDQVEATPNRNGWAQRSKAIVIAPELESWLWSPAEAVAQRLGWGGDFGPLQRWLEAKGLWPAGQFKPPDPKGAMEQALRHKKKVRSSALFGELAASVQFARCRDPAFVELRQILREWFPLTKL